MDQNNTYRVHNLSFYKSWLRIHGGNRGGPLWKAKWSEYMVPSQSNLYLKGAEEYTSCSPQAMWEVLIAWGPLMTCSVWIWFTPAESKSQRCSICCSHYRSAKRGDCLRGDQLQRKESIWGSCYKGKGAWVWERAQGSFQGGKNILYLNCGHSSIGIEICQDLSKCTLSLNVLIIGEIPYNQVGYFKRKWL